MPFVEGRYDRLVGKLIGRPRPLLKNYRRRFGGSDERSRFIAFTDFRWRKIEDHSPFGLPTTGQTIFDEGQTLQLCRNQASPARALAPEVRFSHESPLHRPNFVWCITAEDTHGMVANKMSNPPEKPKKDAALHSLVRVESLIQLGLLLPACIVIGWALGLVLDRWLNQHWMNVAGLILGAIAGFVQTIRIVLSHSKE